MSDPFTTVRNSLFESRALRRRGRSATSSLVETQLVITGQRVALLKTESALRARFDLVIRSADSTGAIAVIESKVAPDNPENIANQIAEYRRHLEPRGAANLLRRLRHYDSRGRSIIDVAPTDARW